MRRARLSARFIGRWTSRCFVYLLQVGEREAESEPSIKKSWAADILRNVCGEKKKRLNARRKILKRKVRWRFPASGLYRLPCLCHDNEAAFASDEKHYETAPVVSNRPVPITIRFYTVAPSVSPLQEPWIYWSMFPKKTRLVFLNLKNLCFLCPVMSKVGLVSTTCLQALQEDSLETVGSLECFPRRARPLLFPLPPF